MSTLLMAATPFLLFFVVLAKAAAVHRIRYMRQEVKRLVAQHGDLMAELTRRRKANRQLEDQRDRKANKRTKLERKQANTERQIEDARLQRVRHHKKKYATLGIETSARDQQRRRDSQSTSLAA